MEGCVDSIRLGSNGLIRVEEETRYLTLHSSHWCKVSHKHIRKAKEANFKLNYSFLSNLWTAEAHVCV